MDEQTRNPKILTLVMLFGAVVFGMVLAGSLNLTVPSMGLARGTGSESVAFASEGAARVDSQTGNNLPSFADLADAVLPAVVSVHTTKIQKASDRGPRVPNELFDRFFRDRGGRPPEDGSDEFRTDSGGSGFFISADGWMVTNYHVIEDATAVEVRLNDREYPAEIKGHDQSTDLALLKVDGKGFDFLALGNAERLRVGEWVMAVGSPLALESSVSVGVVSAKNRSIRLPGLDLSFNNFIQTDAAINRGNSGGPLVNLAGEVIGISTAMSFGAENIGFAVPVDTLRGILPQLRDDGRVRRGYLGVAIDNIDYKLMRGFGLSSQDGALVLRVTADTPAAKAGLEPGDVIFQVDDHKVKKTRDLIDYVSAHTPGDSIKVSVIRDGDTITRKVQLEERQLLIADVQPAPEEDEKAELEWMGIQYGELTRDLRERIEFPREVTGVFVRSVAPSSPLYLEVRRGDVIAEINGEGLRSPRDLERLVNNAISGDFLRLYVHSMTPGGVNSRFVIAEVP